MKYVTEQRKMLQGFFSSQPHTMFSAKEIYELIDNKNVSISAVYRNLSELEKSGVVRKCSKPGSREAFYQYTNADDCKGHIHMICKKCGQTVHMAHEDTELLVNNAHKYKNFLVDQSDTVLYGVCGSCQNA